VPQARRGAESPRCPRPAAELGLDRQRTSQTVKSSPTNLQSSPWCARRRKIVSTKRRRRGREETCAYSERRGGRSLQRDARRISREAGAAGDVPRPEPGLPGNALLEAPASRQAGRSPLARQEPRGSAFPGGSLGTRFFWADGNNWEHLRIYTLAAGPRAMVFDNLWNVASCG
jgi:hypothetical protein